MRRVQALDYQRDVHPRGKIVPRDAVREELLSGDEKSHLKKFLDD